MSKAKKFNPVQHFLIAVGTPPLFALKIFLWTVIWFGNAGLKILKITANIFEGTVKTFVWLIKTVIQSVKILIRKIKIPKISLPKFPFQR